MRSNPLLVVPVGLIAFGLYWLVGTPERATDQQAMIGTWTDQAGPPGNSIRFYFVRRDIPGMPLAEAWEGHLAVTNLFGEATARGSWNYGYWEPLVLNLTVNRRPWFAVIRKLDDDHLLVRFGTNAEEMYAPDALDHAGTRVLTRIGREPDPQ